MEAKTAEHYRMGMFFLPPEYGETGISVNKWQQTFFTNHMVRFRNLYFTTCTDKKVPWSTGLHYKLKMYNSKRARLNL